MPGHGVLLDAHLGDAEAVDHVLAREVDDRRLVHRQVELVDGGDVVLRRRVVAVEPERVASAGRSCRSRCGRRRRRARGSGRSRRTARRPRAPRSTSFSAGNSSTRSAQSGIDKPDQQDRPRPPPRRPRASSRRGWWRRCSRPPGCACARKRQSANRKKQIQPTNSTAISQCTQSRALSIWAPCAEAIRRHPAAHDVLMAGSSVGVAPTPRRCASLSAWRARLRR